MIPFSGRDWCTGKLCQYFLEFLADDSQNFAMGSRIYQDFSRKSDVAKGSSTPPPTHTAETWYVLY